MSYESLGRPDDIPHVQKASSALQLQGRTSNLHFLQQKTSHFCRGQPSVSNSIDHQCKANESAMRSATGEDFFGEIPEASSSSVDAVVKSRPSAVPSHGRSICGEDNILCFQFLYDGQHAGPQLPDDNSYNATTCSVGVSRQFYSVSHSATLSKEAFDSQPSGIDDEFGVATSLGSAHQGCRAIDNYFDNMQVIRSVDESLNDLNENGSKPPPDSSVKIFHREKRLRDDTYICKQAENAQTPFGKHSVYSESSIESGHNPVQQSESREGDKNAEVKEKKNGEARHSRDGSGGGSVVDEAENVRPQGNFQQRGFIHNLRLVEEARDSGLGQVNGMIISSANQDGECPTDINLPQELENARNDKGTFASESSLRSFLSHNFMPPDHQSNIAQRSSAGSDFGGDMQSLSNNTERNGSPDGSMNSGDTIHHGHDVTDRRNTGKDAEVGETLYSEGRTNNDGGMINASPDSDGSRSRENDSSVVKQQNGETLQEREHGDTSLAKHIYPWMKDTRQNTRRKQSTSSNSSGIGDKSSKRERTAYTNSQLVELEKEFHFNRYLCRPRRIEMAQMLNLTERQIKIWFQNRRMKYKKDQKLKTMPMNSLTQDPSFYQQHQHSSNMNADALFSRNNDHRHYPQGRHVHSAESSYRSVPADVSGSGHGGLDCTSGGRCYHGHRHHGGHISQDSSVLLQQPLVRTSSNAYDGVNKTYPQSNQNANSGGRLTSPSSSSSPGTLSPGNGRSSGGYGSEIAMRSTPSSGSEAQMLTQPGCGFIPHVVSPNAPSNSIDDESPVLREKNTSGLECRRLLNHAPYDMSFTGHGFSPFSRRMDDLTTRMPFGNGGTGIGQQISAMSNHYFGGHERQKDSTAFSMIADTSSSMQDHAVGSTRYAQFHNPLGSLSECVQRSRGFSNQPLNGTRYSSMDAYSASFTASNANSFDRIRYEGSSEPSPLDFSRSKSSSPRAQHSEVYLNNRLTHL